MVLKNGLDPYDVLGIPKGSSREVVKHAYKRMLLKTHPDKTGDAKYFMMVHEAYSDIEMLYKNTKQFDHAPKSKVSYDAKQSNGPVNIFKNQKFSKDKFNQFFEENEINVDPFKRGGYDKMMCQRLNYQEEIDDLKKKQIAQKRRQLTIYKEPAPINELYTSNYALLGQKNIRDFSCDTGGTDYMKAYMEPEEQVDTVRRYKNVQHLQNSRENCDFELTAEEQAYMKEKEMNLRRLEQIRLSTMNNQDGYIHNKYTALNNRIRYH